MSKLIKPASVLRAEAADELLRRGMMPFMGGDGTATAIRAATPVEPAYPLGPPVITPNAVTIDTMLRQPTRITRIISDITLQQFLFTYLFSNAGGVSGGAVIFDRPTENDLYANRDIQRVEPGAEFPLITIDRLQPMMAMVEKWGAKSFITDEARDRNDAGLWMREMRKMANTIVRKLNQRAVEEIDRIFTEFPGQVIGGHNWTNVTTQGTNPTPYSQQPVADFVAIALKNEVMELGISHDLLLMNPQEAFRLQLIYGAEWEAVLRAYGYTRRYISNRVEPGTAYSIQSGQLGSYRIEKPLGTETWREIGTERTWVQTSVRPLFYVDNPFGVVKLTGLAG